MIRRQVSSPASDPMARMPSMDELMAEARERMLAENAEAALQASLELMLLSHPSAEVVRRLRSWADYLEERS